MIAAENIVTGYGALKVLKDVSVTVAAGELVTVLGANGAGKSTLLRSIQGLLPIWSGRITFDGQVVTGWPVEKLVRHGLTLVPETRDLFPQLSVHDNLLLGAFLYRHEKNAAQQRLRHLDEVYAQFPVLRERRDARAGSLSGGQQQMLAIGRALMTRPRALMLDEPSLGLAPLIVRQIFSVIDQLRASGLAILLVEQNVRSALKLAQRAYMLEIGTIVSSGIAADVLNDATIQNAYLGEHVDRA